MFLVQSQFLYFYLFKCHKQHMTAPRCIFKSQWNLKIKVLEKLF